MKIKLFFGFFVFLLLTSFVFAQLDLNSDLGGDGGYAVNSGQIEIPYGKNAMAQLPLFSKTYIKVYEGSKISFNIVDQENVGLVLIENSITILNVDPTKIDVFLSTDNDPGEEITLLVGGEYIANYTYESIENIKITPFITHSDEDPRESSVVMYFESTSIKTPSFDLSEFENKKNRISNKNFVDMVFTILIVAIILVVLALIFLNSKSKKNKEEEKPKKKKKK
jgi:large-conductance mechanosensitive channel